MRNTIFTLAVIALTGAATLTLSGCGKEEASFDATETQRSIANDNSRFNAATWRGQNGFEQLTILARGDSTQQRSCPQGDGWASVDLLHPQTKAVVIQLKCSTVSANIGCVKAEDFKARPVLATQENRCNADIPVAFKRIEG